MSDVIPFDIQSEIMKRLPVKSLLQFRSVSKQWKKSVAIVIPLPKASNIVVGFGVCPYTNGPKLVKITVDRPSSMWVVEVFVDGVIYFRGYDDVHLVNGVMSNFVLSFDLKSEKFGEVCLPERLLHTQNIDVTKVNESLGLLEFYFGGEMSVCGVWTRIDGANKPFTKIYTVKVEGTSVYNRVLGFRNNGEVVIQVDDDNHEESRIEVYEPLSGHINGIGINGKRNTYFYATSYMETLLLLDESDSIIH
ncbi:zinc finger, CCHC-type containing protein [Tanacetum coccineum]